jgi:endonuclease-3 related protein
MGVMGEKGLACVENITGVGRLLDAYECLLRYYGPQHWWPAETRFEIIVGAILTQSVAWSNVEKAIANLKAAQALNPAVLDALSVDELAWLIRPAGYYNAKARKIKAFVAYLREHYQYDLDVLFTKEVDALRNELLAIHGIGPETADSIVLYAAGKAVFVVDAYTRRLASRLGLVSNDISYGDLQAAFENNLPHQTPIFQEYHALIVRHAKLICRKIPLCEACPLLSMCEFGQSQTEGSRHALDRAP